MIDSGNANINEFYETTRKKIEIAKMLLKTLKPLDELLTNMLHSYGMLPQAFSAIYQLHQTMQLFQDELKLEELTAELKKHNSKWPQNIHHLSWGKLPSFNSNDVVNAFEHQLQVILTAKDWINVQKIIDDVTSLLRFHFNHKPIAASTRTHARDKEIGLNFIHEEIHVHVRSIMTSFHHHVTKGLSNDMLLEILEKIHGDVTLLCRFLQTLENLTFLSSAANSQWTILNAVKSELNQKLATIDSILDDQQGHQDLNLFLSVLELSRQANQVVTDVETLHNKIESVIRDLSALSKLLSALQRTTESHPLNELASRFFDADSMEVES